jgi:hypothetical protein
MNPQVVGFKDGTTRFVVVSDENGLWMELLPQHYLDKKFYKCTQADGDCPICTAYQRTKDRQFRSFISYLFPILDLDTSKICVLRVGKWFMDKMMDKQIQFREIEVSKEPGRYGSPIPELRLVKVSRKKYKDTPKAEFNLINVRVSLTRDIDDPVYPVIAKAALGT